jgi:glyoxylase-like metal-dependent hydrolase (beta-lactamase superfamily II)
MATWSVWAGSSCMWWRPRGTPQTASRSTCRPTAPCSPGTPSWDAGSAVIAHPDGHLGAYLASLDRLAALAGSTGARWVLPGHGPACPDPAGLLADYLEHRRERLALVSAAMAAGTTEPDDLLAVVYPEVPGALLWAARLSLAAQVEYLTDRAPGLTAQ